MARFTKILTCGRFTSAESPHTWWSRRALGIVSAQHTGESVPGRDSAPSAYIPPRVRRLRTRYFASLRYLYESGP